MKKNKAGESLVGIIVGIFILSFTIFGIINILDFNRTVTYTYNKYIGNFILNVNTSNSLKKIDYSKVIDNEIFYLYKNTASGTIDVFTGSSNQKYKYINLKGNIVDPNTYKGQIFTREIQKKGDILKHLIKPNEISNLIYNFDASNVDGTNNSTVNDLDPVSVWTDVSGNGYNATQTTATYQPQFTNQGNPLGGVSFDGTDDLLIVNNNTNIGNDGNGIYDKVYKEKSFAFVFQTGLDITTTQVIYEQGGAEIGYNLVINQGNLYAGIYNFKVNTTGYTYEWDLGHKMKSVNLGSIIENTSYSIIVTQDSLTTNDPDNTFNIYLNGELSATIDHVDSQSEHDTIGIGSINIDSVQPWDSTIISCTQCMPFGGTILELVGWNHVLSNTEITGIQNYISEKWLYGTSNINYNILDININNYN